MADRGLGMLEIQAKVVASADKFPDERFHGTVPVHERLEIRRPHLTGLDDTARKELLLLENGRFTNAMYTQFGEAAKDVMVRRIAVKNDPTLLLTWIDAGVSDTGVATLMGFGSMAGLSVWADAIDKEHKTDVASHIPLMRAAYAERCMQMAEDMLDRIGVITLPNGMDMSMAFIAEKQHNALAVQDDAEMFRWAQLAPAVKDAVNIDMQRRKALAALYVDKAKAYNPVYRDKAPATEAGAAQIVSVQLNMGISMVQQPQNTIRDVTPATPAKGIMLDVGPVEPPVDDVDT